MSAINIEMCEFVLTIGRNKNKKCTRFGRHEIDGKLYCKRHYNDIKGIVRENKTNDSCLQSNKMPNLKNNMMNTGNKETKCIELKLPCDKKKKKVRFDDESSEEDLLEDILTIKPKKSSVSKHDKY